MQKLPTLIILLLIPFISFSQNADFDALMQEVRLHAENLEYGKALQTVSIILNEYPGNEEALVMKARIYSWNKEYDESIDVLQPLAERQNPNMEALEALINTTFWSGEYDKCLQYCDSYLSKNPRNFNVISLKAQCLERLERDDEATATLNGLEAMDSNNPAISALRALIGRKASNTISASYLNVSTYDPGQAPFHYGYLEYARKFDTSTLVGRANAGHAFNETEMLFEADYYKTFAKKNYLYLNAGVSTGETVFPIARAGAEYYFVPHKQFDYSVGARYMHFKNEDVTLLTGQFAYHSGAYSFAYRPFYDTANELLSHVVSLQRTNEAKERLLRLELQYGNVPYLYLYNSLTEPLSAYRAGIQYQHKISYSFFIRPIFLYEYEEYLPEMFRHRFNLQLIVTKRF